MIWFETQDGTTVERARLSDRAKEELRRKQLLRAIGLRVARPSTAKDGKNG